MSISRKNSRLLSQSISSDLGNFLNHSSMSIDNGQEGRIDVFHAGPLGDDLQILHKGWQQLIEPSLGQTSFDMLESSNLISS